MAVRSTFLGPQKSDGRRRVTPLWHRARQRPSRLLIKFRMDKGLSQQELADLVGTSNSQISRIESGRHRTNLDTLTRIAHALDLRLVLGFEAASPSGRPKRELVAF